MSAAQDIVMPPSLVCFGQCIEQGKMVTVTKSFQAELLTLTGVQKMGSYTLIQQESVF